MVDCKLWKTDEFLGNECISGRINRLIKLFEADFSTVWDQQLKILYDCSVNQKG